MKPLPLTQVLYYLSYRSHRLQPVYWTGRDLHPRPPARTANRIRTGTVQLERLVTSPLVYGSIVWSGLRLPNLRLIKWTHLWAWAFC